MKKGFTLIELVLVITILGILAVSALPSFINITAQAENASRDGVAGAIRSGIALYRANRLATGLSDIYPATLDAAGLHTCVTATPCFNLVLSQGILDTSWNKLTATTYTFSVGAAVQDTYTYDNVTGAFTAPTAP